MRFGNYVYCWHKTTSSHTYYILIDVVEDPNSGNALGGNLAYPELTNPKLDTISNVYTGNSISAALTDGPYTPLAIGDKVVKGTSPAAGFETAARSIDFISPVFTNGTLTTAHISGNSASAAAIHRIRGWGDYSTKKGTNGDSAYGLFAPFATKEQFETIYGKEYNWQSPNSGGANPDEWLFEAESGSAFTGVAYANGAGLIYPFTVAAMVPNTLYRDVAGDTTGDGIDNTPSFEDALAGYAIATIINCEGFPPNIIPGLDMEAINKKLDAAKAGVESAIASTGLLDLGEKLEGFKAELEDKFPKATQVLNFIESLAELDLNNLAKEAIDKLKEEWKFIEEIDDFVDGIINDITNFDICSTIGLQGKTAADGSLVNKPASPSIPDKDIEGPKQSSYVPMRSKELPQNANAGSVGITPKSQEEMLQEYDNKWKQIEEDPQYAWAGSLDGGNINQKPLQAELYDIEGIVRTREVDNIFEDAAGNITVIDVNGEYTTADGRITSAGYAKMAELQDQSESYDPLKFGSGPLVTFVNSAKDVDWDSTGTAVTGIDPPYIEGVTDKRFAPLSLADQFNKELAEAQMLNETGFASDGKGGVVPLQSNTAGKPMTRAEWDKLHAADNQINEGNGTMLPQAQEVSVLQNGPYWENRLREIEASKDYQAYTTAINNKTSNVLDLDPGAANRLKNELAEVLVPVYNYQYMKSRINFYKDKLKKLMLVQGKRGEYLPTTDYDPEIEWLQHHSTQLDVGTAFGPPGLAVGVMTQENHDSLSMVDKQLAAAVKKYFFSEEGVLLQKKIMLGQDEPFSEDIQGKIIDSIESSDEEGDGSMDGFSGGNEHNPEEMKNIPGRIEYDYLPFGHPSGEYTIRNKPIHPTLMDILKASAAEKNYTMQIYSGGQVALNDPEARTQPVTTKSGKRLPANRVGTTTRHDNGYAADIRVFNEDGRPLQVKADAGSKDTIAVKEFVVLLIKNGITSVGAHHNYMNGNLHVDIAHLNGNMKAHWGKGPISAGSRQFSRDYAPGWLTSVFPY